MLSKRIRYFFAPGLLILGGILCGTMMDARTAAGDEVVDRIVAVINNDIITYLELQKELQPYENKIKETDYSSENEEKMRFKVRNEVLNRMIDDKLAEQEALKSNIQFGEAEIDESIENLKAANQWTDETLREALKREGMTMEEYRTSIKKSGMRAKLVNSAVKSQIVVTREEVLAYYDRHKEDYAGELQYHLRYISLMTPEQGKEADKQTLLQKINKVQDELKAGVSFAALAERYSEAPLAAKGGDLGFIAFADLSPQLQEAVKDLTAGETTPVIETDHGYQIFFVEEIASIGGKTFEEARAEIERKLYEELVEEKFRTWLEELRKNAHIKIIL